MTVNNSKLSAKRKGVGLLFIASIILFLLSIVVIGVLENRAPVERVNKYDEQTKTEYYVEEVQPLSGVRAIIHEVAINLSAVFFIIIVLSLLGMSIFSVVEIRENEQSEEDFTVDDQQ